MPTEILTFNYTEFGLDLPIIATFELNGASVRYNGVYDQDPSEDVTLANTEIDAYDDIMIDIDRLSFQVVTGGGVITKTLRQDIEAKAWDEWNAR